MSEFNNVDFKDNCPSCGFKMTDFQTKNALVDEYYRTIEIGEAVDFYNHCDNCKQGVHYTRKILNDCNQKNWKNYFDRKIVKRNW